MDPFDKDVAEVKDLAAKFLAGLERLQPAIAKAADDVADAAGVTAKVAGEVPIPGASEVAAVATDVEHEADDVAAEIGKVAPAPPVPEIPGPTAPVPPTAPVTTPVDAPEASPLPIAADLPTGDSLPAAKVAVPTREEFATAVCAKVTAPSGIGPLQALVTQYALEDTGAAYNPGATELVVEGSTDYNSAGVQDYEDTEQGVSANADTLANGDYPQIVRAMRQNEAAHIILTSTEWDTWGGDGYGEQLRALLPQVQADWAHYAAVAVGTGGTGPFSPPTTVTVSLPELSTALAATASSAVRSAQVLLTSRGYSVGSDGADGLFGPATKAAVEAFQRAHHDDIEVTGVVGQVTWQALVSD